MKIPHPVVAFTIAVCLSACDQQDPAGPRTRAKGTPRPKDELDAGSNRLKTKAEGTIAAVENYLAAHSPRVRKDLRRAEEKFTRDKAKWREKLAQEQKDLQPQIERLREELGKVDTSQNRDRLREELARLQHQSNETDKLRVELEAAGQDIWHEFKAKLTTQEVRNGTPSPTP